MPSNRNSPSFSESAFIAAIDAALDEVRNTADVTRLHECRALFRKRVPFNLRSYVAAALLIRASGAAGNAGRQAQPAGKGRNQVRETGAQRAPGGTDARNGAGKQAQAPADDRSRNRRQEQDRPARQDRPAKQDRPAMQDRPERRDEAAKPAQDQSPPKVRENRYTGEGVVLFVNAGRRQRFYARVAIALLDVAPGVGEDLVGDVRTMDNYSFIEVAPEAEAAAIAALDGYEFKGRALVANRARKKGEAATDGAGLDGSPDADRPGGTDDGQDFAGDDGDLTEES